MENKQHPTFANGKICYIEIPTNNITESASFYNKVFGWSIRIRSDGSVAFDDAVNEVSGTWVLNRKPHAEPGLLIYIMVDNVAATIDAIIANGGKIVESMSGNAPEFIARFSDLSGNVFGIGQQ